MSAVWKGESALTREERERDFQQLFELVSNTEQNQSQLLNCVQIIKCVSSKINFREKTESYERWAKINKRIFKHAKGGKSFTIIS